MTVRPTEGPHVPNVWFLDPSCLPVCLRENRSSQFTTIPFGVVMYDAVSSSSNAWYSC